ncbi:MAG TPA: hypothetical protein VH476_07620 [Solirubrobacterales bacterium]
MRSSALDGGGLRRARLRRVVAFPAALVSLAAALVMAGPALAASPPSIESESVSQVTESNATLEARINPNGLKTSYQFRLESGCLPPMACLAITTYPLPGGELPASSEPESISLDLNSAGVTLKPDTTYAYRVDASNEAGSASGAEHRFTTPGPPLIESESVSDVTATGATLEAQINPGGLETEYEFWLAFANCQNPPPGGAECDSITVQRVGAGRLPASSTGRSVSTTLTHLHPGYSYTYWVVAGNSGGEAVGEHQRFSAQAAPPPTIESEAVSHITLSDATLEADINTQGLETSYEFHLVEHWPCEDMTPRCFPPVRYIPLPSGMLLGSFVTQSVSLDLGSAGVSLEGHDAYEYWVSASNAAGTAQGEPQLFSTSSAGEVEPVAAPSGAASAPSPTTDRSTDPTSSRPVHRHHRVRHHRRGAHRVGRASGRFRGRLHGATRAG